MKTLKNTKTEHKTQTRAAKLFQAVMILAMLFIASDIYAQSHEVEFDIYTTSATKATQHLLADDVALRDCAAVQCEKLTTLKIGTRVRLLAKSETPNTINGITSRWYKVKMGPQVGWIWGGLISQKTMVSQIDPQIKFVFGEAGIDFKGYKRFQIRAIKNGVEVDKIYVKSETLSHNLVSLMDKTDNTYGTDVITLCGDEGESCETNDSKSYVVFKDNKLMQTTSLAALQKVKMDKGYYAFSCELDNE
ncbi:SH3 domain-containing protein [uncultured Psychroserpens sp.]|uniref:SH3 domain-containing protein n=1 Tax=uncultured Psychroserpens sp. TaxID=255436 RepID=UPI00260A0668|nr:SH3 domain-containing protein [uncultured Psychroserpens sp.]